jgi:hypothetical protein
MERPLGDLSRVSNMSHHSNIGSTGKTSGGEGSFLPDIYTASTGNSKNITSQLKAGHQASVNHEVKPTKTGGK